MSQNKKQIIDLHENCPTFKDIVFIFLFTFVFGGFIGGTIAGFITKNDSLITYSWYGLMIYLVSIWVVFSIWIKWLKIKEDIKKEIMCELKNEKRTKHP